MGLVDGLGLLDMDNRESATLNDWTFSAGEWVRSRVAVSEGEYVRARVAVSEGEKVRARVALPSRSAGDTVRWGQCFTGASFGLVPD
jgi:hypothetical protein